MSSSQYIYQDAAVVRQTLQAVRDSPELQRALTLRFDFGDKPVPELTEEGRAVLFELNSDGLITLENIQGEVNRYRSIASHEAEWTQQLSALNARLRTLEMRSRNLEQEQAKGGLFRGRRQQEVQQAFNRLSDQLVQVRNEASEVSSRLDQVEGSRRVLGQQVSTDDTLRGARWVRDRSAPSGGVVISLTPEGIFLLDYLSEMKPEVLRGRSLSQVLVYGMAWSMG